MISKAEKTLNTVLRGNSDVNMAFKDLCSLMLNLGFTERVRGDYFIYSKKGVEEILNLQPIGSKEKAYQVKQVRTVILKIQTLRRAMEPKYEILIYWSAEDNVYLAEVPELPGCIADGSSYHEALKNVELIIRDWIETAQELERTIPAPRGKLMYA